MENLIVYQSPFAKKRVGRDGDGGYVIVDLPGTYDLLLSGGIAGDISFEQQLCAMYPNLTGFAFDASIDRLPKSTTRPKFAFVKKYIGFRNDNSTTDLHEYIQSAANVFLKMDIEGYEFNFIRKFAANGDMSRVKQFVLEFHPGIIPEKGDGMRKWRILLQTLALINRTHTLVHFHANNNCMVSIYDGIRIPDIFEATFIRNDFFGDNERMLNESPIPSALDRPNIVGKPEYSFSGFPYTK